MNNTIEIENKENNQEEQTSFWFCTLKSLVIKVFKFNLYLIISFLELLIKVIKGLFNLNDYKPFNRLTEGKNSILNKIADKNIDKYKVKFVAENLSRHEYNFQRTEQFLAQYSYLQNKLQEIADNQILIDREIYRDIFKRISILVAEAENKALKEGYDHARKTHYQLYGDEINEDFIRDKILSGQSNTDWNYLKEKVKNE